RKINLGESRIKLKSRCPITSVGCPYVDDLLGGGLPVNGVYMIDECNSRSYASVLEKYFIAEGIFYNHKILVASPQLQIFETMKTLPERVSSDYENLTNDQLQNVKEGIDSNLKIAWRYSTAPKMDSFSKAKSRIAYDLSKYATVRDSSMPLFYPSTEMQVVQYNSESKDNQKNLLRIVIEGKQIYSYGDAVFRLESVEDSSHCGYFSEHFDGYFRIVKLPTVFSIAYPLPGSTDLLFELHKKYLEIRVQHLPPSFPDKGLTESRKCSIAEQF
uniref:Elongator complex protein 4 n=1 Tax=Syphacia muris TaxID=451379 RepID=A0A0N5ARE1_9BILA